MKSGKKSFQSGGSKWKAERGCQILKSYGRLLTVLEQAIAKKKKKT